MRKLTARERWTILLTHSWLWLRAFWRFGHAEGCQDHEDIMLAALRNQLQRLS